MKEKRCHDCNVKEGQLHKSGCDMERCPFCGGQLITCACRYKEFGFDSIEGHPTCGLTQKIYENGLPENLEKKWNKVLEVKGCIPYIRYPIVCAYCGKLWPELFMVSNKEWEKYIEPGKRENVICRTCYDHIVMLIDSGSSSVG